MEILHTVLHQVDFLSVWNVDGYPQRIDTDMTNALVITDYVNWGLSANKRKPSIHPPQLFLLGIIGRSVGS
jgi:hypothetical protein